ncbi:hypothetical protein MRX96_057459 [Rhipicephalus microplus]
MALLLAAFLAVVSRLISELGPLELSVEIAPKLEVGSGRAKFGLQLPFELVLASSEDFEGMSRVCRPW